MTGRQNNHEDQSGGPDPFFSEIPGSNPSPSFPTPEQIGRYRVLELLGEGGCGLVYLAEQERPMKRRVALKVIKPGMDSKQVLARFEAERQALALLDHQNIARVFDTGVTEAGQPYFVMEYVHGLPLTEHCDRQKLTIEERLKLFLSVCQAVEHAHSKAIIHRDLKPSNILVSIQGDQAVPKIIDFGIAKAVSQPLTESTLYTEQGQLIGTPEYMSPEQADLTNQDIDTRSDVYSLGVVLYELLTGVLPISRDTLRKAGIAAMRKVICEGDPKTPSTRLTNLGDQAKSIAERRCTDLKTLAKCLNRELDWIPLKALRKDRTRRYRSASELADDINNYLEGRPLIAGPESKLYRMRKLVLRHRVIIAAALSFVFMLVIALVTITFLYTRAENARQAEQTQRQRADAAAGQAAQAQKEAEKRLVDLYEQQGSLYMQSGRLEESLVYLNEAYQIDATKSSLQLLLIECLERQQNPAFHKKNPTIPWEGVFGQEPTVGYTTSPDRAFIALVNEGKNHAHVFDTTTGKYNTSILCEDIEQLAFFPGNRHLLIKSGTSACHQDLKVFSLDGGTRVQSLTRNRIGVNERWPSSRFICPNRRLMEVMYSSVNMSESGDYLLFLDWNIASESPTSQVKLFNLFNGQLKVAEDKSHKVIVDCSFEPTWIHYNNSDSVVYDRITTLHRRENYKSNQVQRWYVPDLRRGHTVGWNADSGLWSPDGVTFVTYEIGRSSASLFHRRVNTKLLHFPHINYAMYSPDGEILVTQQYRQTSESPEAGNDKLITDLWKAHEGQHLVTVPGRDVTNWHFIPDTNSVVFEHQNGQISLWDTQEKLMVWSTPTTRRLKLMDIGPQGRQFITHDLDHATLYDIWDMTIGVSVRQYNIQEKTTDLAASLVFPSRDRTFTYSLLPPQTLVRFNHSADHLITPTGLISLTPELPEAKEMRALVASNIPLRLEDGKMRKSSPKETLLAELAYNEMVYGNRHSDTIQTRLHAIEYLIQINELDEALQIRESLPTTSPNRDLSARRQAITNKLAQAYYEYADYQTRCNNNDAAARSLKLSLSLQLNDPNTLERLAWIQSTSQENSSTFHQETLDFAYKACELTNWSHWKCLSTYAVCCAQQGRFSKAVKWQQRALDALPIKQQTRWKTNYCKRLQLFHSQETYDEMEFVDFPTENLLGWWRFNEGQGDSTQDSSGNEHHMFLTEQIDWQPGISGTALHMKDKEAKAHCSINPIYRTKEVLTLAAWVCLKKPHTAQAKGLRINKGVGVILGVNTVSGIRKGIYFEGPGLHIPSIYPRICLEGGGLLDDGQWYHIAGVFNGNLISLYVNGVLKESTAAQGTLEELDASFNVFCGGIVDEVRLYNRALKPTEIKALHRSSSKSGTDHGHFF